MKFVVDKLYDTCGECDYCAEALMQTPLGVAKQVHLCTLHTLIAPKEPNQQPILLEIDKSPMYNRCPCTDKSATVIDVDNIDTIKPENNTSSIIL